MFLKVIFEITNKIIKKVQIPFKIQHYMLSILDIHSSKSMLYVLWLRIAFRIVSKLQFFLCVNIFVLIEKQNTQNK